MMHAENGPAIDVLAEQLYSAGKTGPYWHGIARAWQLEEEATHRAIMIADVTGAPLYVVHVSAQQAVAQIAAARDRGRNVFGETCPVPVSVPGGPARRPQRGVGGVRGSQVGLLDPAPVPGRGPPGRHVAGVAHQRPADGLHRPLPVLHEGAEGARSATSAPSRTGSAASSTGWTCSTRAWSPDGSPCRAGWRSPPPPRPGCSVSTDARA